MKPHDLGNRFRQHRMKKFLELVTPLLATRKLVRILDLGGTFGYWRALPGLYRRNNVEITILNLGTTEARDSNLLIKPGNACATGLPDMSFDIVHSNSVIEHVGRWPDMQAMAAEVRRLAPGYFVQTPNFWFPIEPHYKLPFVQFLPERARASVIRALDRFPSGATGDSIAEVQRTKLLAARQMRQLFPDAALWRERIVGVTKSLVAIRRPS